MQSDSWYRRTRSADTKRRICEKTASGNYAFGSNEDVPESSNANAEAAIEGMKEFQGLREILDVPVAELEA